MKSKTLFELWLETVEKMLEELEKEVQELIKDLEKNDNKDERKL